MITDNFEQNLIQNEAIAAEAIWETVREYSRSINKTDGLPILAAFLVLPIVFHKKSAMHISTKQKPGILYKAVAEEPEISVFLQNRLEEFACTTWRALNLALSSKLLIFENLKLHPHRRSPFVNHSTEDVRTMMSAARRLGVVFSEIEFSQITSILNVKF